MRDQRFLIVIVDFTNFCLWRYLKVQSQYLCSCLFLHKFVSALVGSVFRLFYRLLFFEFQIHNTIAPIYTNISTKNKFY